MASATIGDLKIQIKATSRVSVSARETARVDVKTTETARLAVKVVRVGNMAHNVGDKIRIEVFYYEIAAFTGVETPVDPTSTQVTITPPSGNDISATEEDHPNVGQYSYVATLTEAGAHLVKAEAAGAFVAVETSKFTVYA